jgi:hypothetical protein
MLKGKRREYYEGCLKLLDFFLAQRSPLSLKWGEDFEAASVEDTSGGKD